MKKDKNQEKEKEEQEETPSQKPKATEPVEDWETKAKEYLDGWKRTQAEFENYKKREAGAKKELGGYLIEKLVLDIIPVLDNFRAATLHTPEDQKESPWVTGISYIEKQLAAVLSENGIQMITPKEGDEFDPKIHEAISAEDKDSESVEENEKHIITTVHQNGYKYGERVIRPAKVTVK